MMERDSYLGRILTGRISSGIIRIGDKIHGLRINGSAVEKVEEGKVCGFTCSCCITFSYIFFSLI